MEPIEIAALAKAAGFEIAADRLQGVAEVHKVTMAMAARIMAVELDEPGLENGPVFDAWSGYDT